MRFQASIVRGLIRPAPLPIKSSIATLTDAELEERVRIVGHLKRFSERYCADAAFRESLARDIRGTLDGHALQVETEDAQAFLEANCAEAETRPFHWTTNLQHFRDFVLECQGGLESIALASASTSAKYSAWRQRQLARLRFDHAGAGDHIVRPAVALELSKGCSVGCWFCAISAERFGGNFDYATGADLWRHTLRQLSAVLGPAAASGFCYWATDPLDNPDYERFATAFREELGAFPPTTTALPLKSAARTRGLLELALTNGSRLNRFSVLTLPMLDRLHREFTPEELVFVEVVLQNPGALVFTSFPRTHAGAKIAAGRVLEKGAPESSKQKFVLAPGTIACIVGFLLNMVEQTIQLVSPCVAGDEWPLGYRVHCSATFSDAAELRGKLDSMIETHMPSEIPEDSPVRFLRNADYAPLADGFRVSTRLYAAQFRSGPQMSGFNPVMLGNLIQSGKCTPLEIVTEMETQGVPRTHLQRALDFVYRSGVLEDLPRGGIPALTHIAPQAQFQRAV